MSSHAIRGVKKHIALNAAQNTWEDILKLAKIVEKFVLPTTAVATGTVRNVGLLKKKGGL